MPILSHILGIDIGKTGGVALLTRDGVLLDVEPMPTLDDGPKGRPAVNPALLAALVRRWAAAEAFVEYVFARPVEVPAAAFSFGRCKGVVEGILATSGVPMCFLTPPIWKRAVGLAPSKDMKDAARSEAIRR